MNKGGIVKELRKDQKINTRVRLLEQAYFSGSLARREETEDSDIDVVIEQRHPDLFGQVPNFL